MIMQQNSKVSYFERKKKGEGGEKNNSTVWNKIEYLKWCTDEGLK